MGDRRAFGKSTSQPQKPRFAAEFLLASNRPKVVRIVPCFDHQPVLGNATAKGILDEVLRKWPRGLSAKYVITSGGFLSLHWPKAVEVKDPRDPSSKAVSALFQAGEMVCRRFLTPHLRRKLKAITDFVTFGVDPFYPSRESYVRCVQLVCMYDLSSDRVWVTGKSYPTAGEQAKLVCVNRLETHKARIAGDRVLLLGCHDLNMFSNRALKNASPRGWRAAQMTNMRTVASDFAPNVVLQHPHTTSSPHNWATALGGLKAVLESNRDNLTFASAGRWYSRHRRRPLRACLKATALGKVATVVVRRHR